jgi:hypothetical protein
MKKVVHGREVAHLWAHQTQADARSNGRGNIFFTGDTIYSYGSHFPIARHVENSKGQKAILFTTKGYSSTTAKHKSYVRNAIPGSIDVFYVRDVMDKPKVALLDDYQAEINELAVKAARSRQGKDWCLEELRKKVEEFSALAEFIGSKRKPKIPDQKWLDEQKKLAKEQAKNDRAAKEAREAAQRAEDQENFSRWLAGESVWFPSSYRRYNGIKTDYLRIEGEEVVTSSSARVPLDHVRKIVPFVLGLINEGKTYQRNGHTIHLGHYPIESIDADGTLTVGCHRFSKEEILRFAEKL